jgi:nickel-dependent lactate racemase
VRTSLEYGDGHVEAELPDSATVITAGRSRHEPEPLSDPLAATRDAIRVPLGVEPLDQLVGRGSKITIAFPDRVKGGVQDTAHRKVAIPALLDELEHAGVAAADVTLICAIGLHRKNTEQEMAELLGENTLSRIDPAQVINHDAEDVDRMVDAGTSRHGDPVQFNKAVVDADLSIMIGHTSGNPYGGFSGGYKMPATGLTSWRSIRSHHSPGTMHRPDFVPPSTHSHFRDQLRAIGRAMEAAAPRPFFAVDAVLDAQSRQLAVAAGSIAEVEQATWPTARMRTELTIPGPPADVLVVGMPRNFHYGSGMGSNPILMLQAAGSSISRAKRALRDDPVIIVASICDGWFNEPEFPATVAVYEALQAVGSAAGLDRFEEDFSTRTEWVDAYREGVAYHPFHAFSMAYMGAVATLDSAAVIIAGAEQPSYAHGMGALTADNVQDALQQAERFVGSDPRVVVVPELSKPAYHLAAATST